MKDVGPSEPQEKGLNRNFRFGLPAPESIHPFVVNRALFGALSLSGMVGATLFCLPGVLNACSRRLLHQFARHRRVPGAFASIFLAT